LLDQIEVESYRPKLPLHAARQMGPVGMRGNPDTTGYMRHRAR
jgi:hypothetical protein